MTGSGSSSRVLLVGGLCLAMVCMGCNAGAQETTQDIRQSYTRARALLDAAVMTHGGADALRAAQRIRVTTTGNDYWRNQSRRVDPPYDVESNTDDLLIDLPKGQLIWESTSAFPGGFHNAGRQVIGGASPFYLNLRQRLLHPQPGRTIENMRGVLHNLPHLVLLTALDHRAGLRWLGRMRLANGAEVEVIATSTPAGLLTLGIDPASHQLRALLGVQADPLIGDAPRQTEFLDYVRVGTILMPGRRVTSIGDEITRDALHTSTTLDVQIPDSLLAPPPGFSEPVSSPGQSTEPVQELATGVWAIREAGYWSLAIAFADHVLVVEAPRVGVPETIARIATLAPGKAIRYVVPTHHHDDHAGGVRHYLAAGAAVVTTPGNRRYFEQMAGAHSTLQPDKLSAEPRSPRIEVIDGGRRVFSDGTRSVEIHDIGPSPHANEMLIAWLPGERIVFQGDLGPTGGTVYPNSNNETTAHYGEWLRRKGWNIRIHAGTHGAPASMAALEETLKQPIAP